MSVMDHENTLSMSTENWTTAPSFSDQSNPTTRRLPVDAFAGELETLAIERNGEFYATIIERIGVDHARLVNADEVVPD